MKKLRYDASSEIRILLSRPDRIGDVILSTPVFRALKEAYPKSRVGLIIQKNLTPLLKGLSTVDEIIEYDPDRIHSGWKGLKDLSQKMKSFNPDVFLALQSEKKIAWAAYLAGIRSRIGPLSKPHSFITYNYGVRQNRSQVAQHESEYNLELLLPLGVEKWSQPLRTEVAIPKNVVQQAKEWLKERGYRESQNLVAVHPGMGGSALNWPKEKYIELIQKLLTEENTVLLTGGPEEGALLSEITGKINTELRSSLMSYGGESCRTIEFLGGLYTCCKVVVAPSTGPLHLATAVGTPVVSFYPPIRVQSVQRWGPLGMSRVFTPKVDCGQTYRCLGSACQHFFCMEKLDVDPVQKQVYLLMQNKDNLNGNTLSNHTDL